VASVRLYDESTPVFQISPILQLDSSSKLREEIKRYLDGALKDASKTLPPVRQKIEARPAIEVK